MAENATLARPYAEAAFELAKAAGALAAWQEALDRLAAASRDPAMHECINDPRLTTTALAELFTAAAGELTPEQSNFLHILIDNRRLSVLPEISALFAELKNAQEGTREALVTSAFPLSDAQLMNLVAELERKFGCKIKANVKVDPELIGGVRIALGDQVIDASVRGKLNAMAVALKD